jgi:hypothetical protein
MAEPLATPRETRDVDKRLVALFALGLAAFIALALVALRLIFGLAPSPQPFAAGTGLPGSGAVMLETDPDAAPNAYEAGQKRLLTTYGWVDRKAGIARIPIDAAIALIASRGIPDWNAAPAPPDPACAALLAVPRAPQAAPCLQPPGGPLP